MTITRAIYDGPPSGYGRNRGPKQYIAVHNTSNDATVRDEISYSKWREDKTSTHYYADRTEIAQSLDTALCANHAGSAEGNHEAIAWELTGTNTKTRAWWLANLCWPLIAAQMAADCREFDIPPRLLTVTEMRAGVLRGFVTHDLMRQAWGGTDHTDPGKNFPMDHLLALVAANLEEDDMTPEQLSAAILATRLTNGFTLNNALVTLLSRTPVDIVAQLTAILAAAKDAKNTDVILSDDAQAQIESVRAAIEALVIPTAEQVAEAVLDEDHERSAT